MKKVIYIIALLLGAMTMAQTITVNGTPMLVSDDISFPFWLESGSSISPEVPVSSISVLEFNIVPNNNGNDMVFNQVISVTEGQTVPEGKTWKVESVLMENQGFDSEENNNPNLIDNGNFVSAYESGLHVKFHEPILSTNTASIELNANILPGGGDNPSWVGFCFSKLNNNPTLNDESYIRDGIEINNQFAHKLAIGYDLELNSTYFVRAFVSNIQGVTYSDTYSFTTGELYIGKEHEGGFVFSIDSTGQHGLVVSDSLYNGGQQYALQCNYNNIPSNSWSFGYGETNSNLIANSSCSSSYIFEDIVNMSLNGYVGWFIPSTQELQLIANINSGFGNLFPEGLLPDFLNSGYFNTSTWANWNQAFVNVQLPGGQDHQYGQYDSPIILVRYF